MGFKTDVRRELDTLQERTKFLERDTVPCEKCGCMVKRDMAIAGRDEVRVCSWSLFVNEPPKYIHTPYYCRVHAPKGRKA